MLQRLALAAALAILIASPRALAQFVDYFTTHGDWTVTCARDMLSGQVTCRLGAPPPRLVQTPTANLTVAAPAEGAAAVILALPGVIDAAKAVSAHVDTGPAIETGANRYGEGRWESAAATKLIESMRVGDKLTLTWWLEGETAPRAATIGLGGFDAALEDYRKRLTATGAAPALN